MKKIFVFISLILLFCCCKQEPTNWIAISAETDENTTFHRYKDDCWIETNTNKLISFSFFLLPEANKDFTITELYSTNIDVLSIISVDKKNGTIIAKALDKGDAQIIIKTKSFGSTSMQVYVN